MKQLLVVLLLCLPGCRELFFPADEHLEVPGYKIRLHCYPECPDHDKLRAALAALAAQMKPHINFDPYQQWSYYGITFRESAFDYRGQKLLGVTLHNRCAVAIWMPYECPPNPSGICPGVLGWEMKLVLTERVLRQSTEAQKIAWLTERHIEHVTWDVGP